MDKSALLKSFHSCLFCYLGKRKRDQQELSAVLREMQASDERQLEQRRAQRDRHFQILLEDAQEARRMELEVTREHMQQTAAFNQASLGTLSQIVQALSGRRDPAPSPLD